MRILGQPCAIFVQVLWRPWFLFDLLIDVYFICDLLLNFRTAVYTKDGFIAYQAADIARAYMRGWFVVDIMSDARALTYYHMALNMFSFILLLRG